MASEKYAWQCCGALRLAVNKNFGTKGDAFDSQAVVVRLDRARKESTSGSKRPQPGWAELPRTHCQKTGKKLLYDIVVGPARTCASEIDKPMGNTRRNYLRCSDTNRASLKMQELSF